MSRFRLFAPALAGLLVLFPLRSGATVIAQNFSANPLQDGWQIFGDTNLFQWDSTNQDLQVTWDSTQPNSYFYHPLGTILARDDDFSFAFDLRLSDIVSGNEPGKTGPLQIGVGFLQWEDATNTEFSRGLGAAANITEFDYYPTGYYVSPPDYIYPAPPTVSPTMISSNVAYAYNFLIQEMTANDLFHVVMTYTSTNQTLVTAMTRNGSPFGPVPNVVLADFAFDDFRVDMFSVSSYSSAGDDYDSILAHGTVGNIVVTLPPPPVRNLSVAFSNTVWDVQFLSRSNWLYTLERTADCQFWADVAPSTFGNATNLVLQDTSPPTGKAFYRVRANRP